jgi:hypothetical protein
MAKLNESNKILENIKAMVEKEAAAKPVASGAPGKDTHPVQVSPKHETVDQNAVGADKVKPQTTGVQQPTSETAPTVPGKKADEAEVEVTANVQDDTQAKLAAALKELDELKAKMAAETKTAEVHPSVEKLGKELIDMISNYKEAAKPEVVGAPGKDTHPVQVSAKHDTSDKNAVGADKVKPQTTGVQQPTCETAPCIPGKSAEETDRIASYELGKLWAETIFKQSQAQDLQMAKEAGKQDFEQMIAQASEQLQATKAQQQKQASENRQIVKQAEMNGKMAFTTLLNQAKLEQKFAEQAEQIKKLSEVQSTKTASVNPEVEALKQQLAEKEAQLNARLFEEQEQAKYAAWSQATARMVVDTMKNEILNQKG